MTYAISISQNSLMNSLILGCLYLCAVISLTWSEETTTQTPEGNANLYSVGDTSEFMPTNIHILYGQKEYRVLEIDY